MTEFDTDNVYYERSGDFDILTVVFNYVDQPLNARAHHKFLKGTKSNKLFLHSGDNNWFQGGVPGIADSFEGLLNFCSRIRDVFDEKHIVYVGHSMGGFGALACGVVGRADRILVSVPEIELCQEGSLSLRRLRDKDKITCPSIAGILAGNSHTPITAIFGKQDAGDMRIAADLGQCPLVSIVELDCDHMTFPYLRDKAVLGKIFEAFIDTGSIEDLTRDL